MKYIVSKLDGIGQVIYQYDFIKKEKGRRGSIQLKVTSSSGTESPMEWYAKKVKEFAKEKYGLEIKVEIIPTNTYSK
jgi:hypothetical protein